VEEKKAPNPLDLLPPSSFDLFNFKTFFVNHKDKSGAAVDEMLKIYDPAGYSVWFLHYDKYKGEGEVLYKTENLSKGFLQRFDQFRKHAFARHLVLGDEPSLEIEGVWLFRGTTIP
jgi:elongation factor 1-gamma